MSPNAANGTLSGVTVTAVGTRAATMRFAQPVTPDEVAEISVSPGPMPVARPAASTVAMDDLLDAQENSIPVIACPLASVALAANRSVSPWTRVSAVADTVMASGVCATATSAAAVAVSAFALIVAVPLARALTSPAPSIDATSARVLVQATATPGIAFPYWSRTSALNWTVASRADRVVLPGVIVTVAGRGGSSDGPACQSPHAEVRRNVEHAKPRLRRKTIMRYLFVQTVAAPCQPGASGSSRSCCIQPGALPGCMSDSRTTVLLKRHPDACE